MKWSGLHRDVDDKGMEIDGDYTVQWGLENNVEPIHPILQLADKLWVTATTN